MNHFNWTCPYCGQHTTITEPNYSEMVSRVETYRSKHGQVRLKHIAISCPNPECRQLSLSVDLEKLGQIPTPSGSRLGPKGVIQSWNLLPRSRARKIPEYVPAAVRADYEEACLIVRDSPKASATLSRRCLQGVVRDFWQIPVNKRGNLGAELSFIKSKVEPETWEAIQAIREVGDIGAHMEKDVNYIVDVEPKEAELLIELIEALIEDWYVTRRKREERANDVKALTRKKASQKRGAKAASKDAIGPKETEHPSDLKATPKSDPGE